jgi:hypothetical protein
MIYEMQREAAFSLPVTLWQRKKADLVLSVSVRLSGNCAVKARNRRGTAFP